MLRLIICMFALFAEHHLHPCAAPKKDYRLIRLPVEIEMNSWLPALKLERSVIAQALNQTIKRDNQQQPFLISPLIKIVQDYVGDTFDEEMSQFFGTEKWEQLKKSWLTKEHGAANIWGHINSRICVAIRNGSVIYCYSVRDDKKSENLFVFEYVIKEGTSRMITSPIYARYPQTFHDYTAWQSILLSRISKRDLFSEMLSSEFVTDEPQNKASLKERIAKKLDGLPDEDIKVISVFHNINKGQPEKDFLVLPSFLQNKNYQRITTVTRTSPDGEISECIDRQSGVINKTCRNLYMRGSLLHAEYADVYYDAKNEWDTLKWCYMIYNYNTGTYDQIQEPTKEFSCFDYHKNRLIMFREKVHAFTDDREITHTISTDHANKCPSYKLPNSIGFEGGIVADYVDENSPKALFVKGIDGRVPDQQITTGDKHSHFPTLCRFHDNVYLITNTENQTIVFKADYSAHKPIKFEPIGHEEDISGLRRAVSGCSEGIVALRDQSDQQICILDFSGLHDQYLDKQGAHLLTSEQKKFISPKLFLSTRLNNQDHSRKTITERLQASPHTIFSHLAKNFRGYHINKDGYANEPID